MQGGPLAIFLILGGRCPIWGESLAGFFGLYGGVLQCLRWGGSECCDLGRSPGHFFDLSGRCFFSAAGMSCGSINLGKAGDVSGAGQGGDLPRSQGRVSPWQLFFGPQCKILGSGRIPGVFFVPLFLWSLRGNGQIWW